MSDEITEEEYQRGLVLARERAEKHGDIIEPLCIQFGYGAVMYHAQLRWERKDDYGCHTIGPCKGMMEPCICVDRHGKDENFRPCNFCAGACLLTKAVKKFILEHENNAS